LKTGFTIVDGKRAEHWLRVGGCLPALHSVE
jgi:hypothetical protein